VWYRARGGEFSNGHGKPHPHLLEEPYNLEDALLVGGLANSLIRHSDRVRVSCLAQLINVIAPIAANEDGILRHTIFYPYSWALKHAHGRALSVQLEGPGYEVATIGRPVEDGGLPIPGFGEVKWVDVAATTRR
jgi:alpha-L-arabinofuranosidase